MRKHIRQGAAAAMLATATALMSMPPPAAAADEPPAAATRTRPKICLVLSGGGARGAAHVGVLKVLEEYRVPIDCIAGTSMGALVGAAYATGTTVAEMDEILAGISTELLFKEKPPREERSMRSKEDDRTILFSPEIGVSKGKMSLSKGVVSGVQLETVLRQLSKAKGYHRFDDLPIPFRAVATNLVTGKAVIFKDGELANVMRASMSVPGAVAPAEFGGMMLVDGMLTSNLPVGAARAMGADIIIAVNVGTPLLKREEINGIFGVAGQMLSILTEQNVEASIASLKPADILISPELGDTSTGDFDDLPKIAPKGEVAARTVAERLARLALPAPEYAALRRRQLVSVAADVRPVDEIRFENLQRVNAVSAQSRIETKPGEPIDQKKLDRDMRSLYGTGDFEHVNYRFIEEPGRRVLAVDAVEKSWGPNYLRFGLGLSSDFSGDSFFNILASYRRTWLNSLGAEWRTDVQIGHARSLHSEFYQPVDAKGRFFVAPRVDFEARTIPLYQGEDRIAIYDIRSGNAAFDVGTVFGSYGELRLGLLRGKFKPTLDSGPETLSPGSSSVNQAAYTARLTFDRLDSAIFPRSGWQAGVKLFDASRGLGAADAYTKWDLDGVAVYSIDNHTFNFGVKAGGSIGSKPLPRYDQFSWGGFLHQSGYAEGQLAGESLRYGRAMYYHRIMRGSLLEGAYGGIAFEVGKIGNPLVSTNSDGVLRSGSIFVGADSPIGPAYLGYGRAQDGNSNWYFYLGRPF